MHARIRVVSLPTFLIAVGVIAALVSRGLPEDPPAPADGTAKNQKAPAARSQPAGAATIPAPWKKNIAQWRAEGQADSADNSFCIVCHLNYKKERLVTLHKPEGVGCETCHGISDKHSEDEDNLIPPDVLFAKSLVALFCTQCHSKKDLVQENDDHKSFFAKQPAKGQKTCTDCHSMHHTLEVRTRRWDKNTRKLQWYDGVRMMQERDAGKK